MCRFFSLVSDGRGKCYYFNAEQRRDAKQKELVDRDGQPYEPDSHTSIAYYYGFAGEQEDSMNKWEYNPFTQALIADQINTKDDREAVEQFCTGLDLKTIVPELEVRHIVNPLTRKVVKRVTKKHITSLKQWDSVWDSVWASVGESVGESVGDSVRDSVGASVWDSVRDYVWDSVGASVRDSVGDSVRDSVRDSVWDSVWDSVRDYVVAYTGTFFPGITKWQHAEHLGPMPWQPMRDLYEAGLAPSFDGTTWRLHTGPDAKVVYEITAEALKETK